MKQGAAHPFQGWVSDAEHEPHVGGAARHQNRKVTSCRRWSAEDVSESFGAASGTQLCIKYYITVYYDELLLEYQLGVSILKHLNT